MARIRTVKPEFWTDGDVMDLSQTARLLFLGSWNFAMCDYGHLADDPRQLRRLVLPEDEVMVVRVDGAWTVQPLDPAALVEEIIAAGRMTRIEIDGDTYLHIKRFTRHQRLEKRWTPRCPACKALGNTHDPAEPRETSREPARTRSSSASDRTGQDRTSAAAAADRAAAAAGAGASSDADLPGPLAILRSRLQAHTVLQGLRFDSLTAEQTQQLVDLVTVHGDERLVAVARDTCRNPAPTYVTAFLGTWASLPMPGQRLGVVPGAARRCEIHQTKVSAAGTCTSCAADRLAEGTA